MSKSIAGREVTFLRLHNSLHIPGLGDIGSVFPPQNRTVESVVMTAVAEGVVIELKVKGSHAEILVTPGNILLAKLGPEAV